MIKCLGNLPRIAKSHIFMTMLCILLAPWWASCIRPQTFLSPTMTLNQPPIASGKPHCNALHILSPTILISQPLDLGFSLASGVFTGCGPPTVKPSSNQSGTSGSNYHELYLFDSVDPAWLIRGNAGPLPDDETEPAGQVRGEPTGDASDQIFLEGSDAFVQSLPSDIAAHVPLTQAEAADDSPQAPPASTTNRPLICDQCGETFALLHQLNTHMKKHTRPFHCQEQGCNKRFRYKKDLTHHKESKHPDSVPNLVLFWCPVEGCKDSLGRGAGKPRERNVARHIASQHPGEVRAPVRGSANS
ncbi:hypothetical protein MRS44_003724 [Fusarium solani]|uniref:uncharacterized protein n=1 Tax=Fusarium solani TaxID=169388 RepID=UPI0032C4628D|nr:hypothetical protein MRS44_003724 [Fusarium solani]